MSKEVPIKVGKTQAAPEGQKTEVVEVPAVMTVKLQQLSKMACIPRPMGGARAADLSIPMDFVGFVLPPGDRCKIPLGFAAEVPPGYGMLILPQAALSDKHGIDVTTSLVDSDCCGEVVLLIRNRGRRGVQLLPGMPVAQALIVQTPRFDFEMAAAVSVTDRVESVGQ